MANGSTGAGELVAGGQEVYRDTLSREFFDERQAELRGRVSEARFAHVQGVVDMAERLARIYGVDVAKARLAALLHDWDKGYDEAGIRQREKELEAKVDPWLVEHMPWLLHGPTAACALGRDYPDIPQDVLAAIERHTTGSTDMSALDMVLYISDALEEGRDFGCLDDLRARIGRKSLQELFVDVLAYWTILIIEGGKPLHPDTVDVWNAYVMKK